MNKETKKPLDEEVLEEEVLEEETQEETPAEEAPEEPVEEAAEEDSGLDSLQKALEEEQNRYKLNDKFSKRFWVSKGDFFKIPFGGVKGQRPLYFLTVQ